MRFSDERIKQLQTLLKCCGIDYPDEQAQEAGLAIMRFALAKSQRQKELNEMENDNGLDGSSDNR